ncbi:MAG TPA: hypothetical protein VJX93_03775 [Candidatus Methanomethylophilaceae archaeon]|nr:hypothetical protein [Candidatus Methanomethylophilaceae archaeon]
MADKLTELRNKHELQQYKAARCIYRLQREAGMSFREARIAMIDRGESALVISREFGMNQDAFRMASLRSERKLRKTKKTLEEFCEGDLPAFILAD